MDAIRIQGLRKRYGERTALDGIDLDVADGEVFALLGPNGAGKTTAVEILAGLRRRDAGEVRVLGEDPRDGGRRWRYGLGIVPQHANDLAQLTVAEVVGHFARYYPKPRDPAEVIELVGLTDKARSRLSTLSGGQRRRVDVAIGVVGNPRLLFLDEPTTGFDPEARRRFWALLRTLSCTILLTTHYLEEAEHLADRVGVIVDGRVVACAEPALLGGRETRHATVSWRDGDEPRWERTDNPAALVMRLADRYGGSVPALTVTRPTLEDVYLELIGAGG